MAGAGVLPGVAPDTSRSSVAVVDDDAGFARYLETFLALRGYDARSYTRGDEILAAIRHGEPDTVLLDVAMPGMDGLQTLKALKSARPGLPVIMLSAREQANVIVEAMHLGADDFVVKPHDAGGLGDLALDSVIAQAIGRHRAVTDPAEAVRRFSGDPGGLLPGWDGSPAMREVAQIIEQVSDSDVTVLIRGESGVGKELVAKDIHHRSPRRQMPFVTVNCAALPAELIESELFGHEKGAFTGAAATRIGRFEEAHRGTIFLDEIGEMKPALQAKLLQVLQDGEFTRLGSNKTVTTDARVLAATNQNLEELIRCGQFREDLYYRLRVIETVVPPLRERREEILPLADFFMTKYSERYKRPLRMIPPELWRPLQAYDWPGNVRELENAIKRFVILQDERLLAQELSPSRLAKPGAAPVPSPGSPVPLQWTDGRRLVDVVREVSLAAQRIAIVDTLRQVQWNRREAAQRLGVTYKTLLNKIAETGVGPADQKPG